MPASWIADLAPPDLVIALHPRCVLATKHPSVVAIGISEYSHRSLHHYERVAACIERIDGSHEQKYYRE